MEKRESYWRKILKLKPKDPDFRYQKSIDILIDTMRLGKWIINLLHNIVDFIINIPENFLEYLIKCLQNYSDNELTRKLHRVPEQVIQIIINSGGRINPEITSETSINVETKFSEIYNFCSEKIRSEVNIFFDIYISKSDWFTISSVDELIRTVRKLKSENNS